MHLILNVTYPLTKYLWHAYYVLGSVLGARGAATNSRQKSLPSWDGGRILHHPG